MRTLAGPRANMTGGLPRPEQDPHHRRRVADTLRKSQSHTQSTISSPGPASNASRAACPTRATVAVCGFGKQMFRSAFSLLSLSHLDRIGVRIWESVVGVAVYVYRCSHFFMCLIKLKKCYCSRNQISLFL
jgi:hypothetical protein